MTIKPFTPLDALPSSIELGAMLPTDRAARKAALQANLRPFAKQLYHTVKTFGRKPPMLEVARIVIVECLEAGFNTEFWIRQVSYGLPMKTADVMWVLQHDRGPDSLWDWDENERYALNPSV